MSVPEHFYTQASAVPYRDASHVIEILLITSTSGHRWIVPKGVIEPGATAEQTALDEAHEEAGVRGDLVLPPVGRYEYEKWGGTCQVEVFALRVTAELDNWPEAGTRERRWLDAPQAIRLVDRPALKRMIRSVVDRAQAGS